MYYAIHNTYRFLDTAFNATSTFEVREKVFAALVEQIGLENCKPITGDPLEEVLGRMGLTLHKQEQPFIKTKKFRVVAIETTYRYLDVDADSAEHARRIAEATDEVDFYGMTTDERPGSFTIVEVNPIS